MKVQRVDAADQPPKVQVLMGNSPYSLTLTHQLCSSPQKAPWGWDLQGEAISQGLGKGCGTGCKLLGLQWQDNNSNEGINYLLQAVMEGQIPEGEQRRRCGL